MKSIARRALRRSRQAARAAATRLGWHARPDFLILGAQKAGTSALHTYLLSHPDLAPPASKELYYFSPESFLSWPGFPGNERYERIARAHSDAAVRKDVLRWYHSQFPLPLRRRLNHEATVCYLHSREAPARIRAYRADMKLIVLLRDPVERAFSAWNMLRGFTFHPWNLMQETRSFEQAVRDEIDGLDGDPKAPTRGYLSRGIYHEQLRRYFDHFPRDQILILEQRELLAEPLANLNTVCHFLGIRPFEHEQAWPAVNVGTYESEMSEWARTFLAFFYDPHNKALFNLIGREFDWARPQSQPDANPDSPAPSVGLKKSTR